MRHLSIAERLGMAEARGARLESRILKQEAVIDALRAQVARLDAAMRGLLRPVPAPKPIEIEDNPAILCAALSAARMSDIAARVGAAGRQRVIDHWSWRHTAEKTVDEYRALLAQK